MSTDRLPPQNIKAEVALLGSILLDKDAMLEVAARLRPEHFYRATHQTVYRAMLRLHEASMPIDCVMLADELQTSGEIKAVSCNPARRVIATLERCGSATNSLGQEKGGPRRPVVRGSRWTESIARRDDRPLEPRVNMLGVLGLDEADDDVERRQDVADRFGTANEPAAALAHSLTRVGEGR